MADATTQPDVAIAMLAGGAGAALSAKARAADRRGADDRALLSRDARDGMARLHLPQRERSRREIDLQLDAPRLIDPQAGGGPLPAFLSACSVDFGRMHLRGGGRPAALRRARLDDAVGSVETRRRSGRPRSTTSGIEPLAALYLRRAVPARVRRSAQRRDAAMRDLIERARDALRADGREHFYNVNRAERSDANAAAGR